MRWVVRYSRPLFVALEDLSEGERDAVLALAKQYASTKKPTPTRVSSDPRDVLRLSSPPLHVMVRLDRQKGIVHVDHAFREDDE